MPAFARAARSGGGTISAAAMTRAKAKNWRAMPSVSPGIGSPNTTMPPMMVDTLAAVEVEAMTGTASPSCRPRAEA